MPAQLTAIGVLAGWLFALAITYLFLAWRKGRFPFDKLGVSGAYQAEREPKPNRAVSPLTVVSLSILAFGLALAGYAAGLTALHDRAERQQRPSGPPPLEPPDLERFAEAALLRGDLPEARRLALEVLALDATLLKARQIAQAGTPPSLELLGEPVPLPEADPLHRPGTAFVSSSDARALTTPGGATVSALPIGTQLSVSRIQDGWAVLEGVPFDRPSGRWYLGELMGDTLSFGVPAPLDRRDAVIALSHLSAKAPGFEREKASTGEARPAGAVTRALRALALRPDSRTLAGRLRDAAWAAGDIPRTLAAARMIQTLEQGGDPFRVELALFTGCAGSPTPNPTAGCSDQPLPHTEARCPACGDGSPPTRPAPKSPPDKRARLRVRIVNLAPVAVALPSSTQLFRALLDASGRCGCAWAEVELAPLPRLAFAPGEVVELWVGVKSVDQTAYGVVAGETGESLAKRLEALYRDDWQAPLEPLGTEFPIAIAPALRCCCCPSP